MIISGPELMQQLDRLAEFSEDPNVLTRTYLTPTHRRAGEQLITWMTDAGMAADFDAVGNVVGRYEGATPGAPALLLGSHYDTVRDAGRYDGAYGIVAAIACVNALHVRDERLPFAIEVIGFADEEGVRFGATLLGSRAVVGDFDLATLEKADGDGICMHEAFSTYGLDPERIGDAAHARADVLAYVEMHIEQGPVLLGENLALGIVTAIAGATRFAVRVEGLAGHAGTVPMRLRRDAAVACAEAVLFVEQRCSQVEELVGTVGELSVPNGAANVIPGRAEFSIDIRAGDDALRTAVVNDVLNQLEAIGARRDVRFSVTRTHEANAAQCAPWLMTQLENAVERAGVAPRRLPSGAGHDAMAFPMLTDIAMLFVRCGAGGISHHPDETMTADDAATGANVLLDFVRNFTAKSSVLDVPS